ncbi:MAG: hypothetical protein WCY08_16440 [Rhodocyclaceae bacterium]
MEPEHKVGQKRGIKMLRRTICEKVQRNQQTGRSQKHRKMTLEGGATSHIAEQHQAMGIGHRFDIGEGFDALALSVHPER